MAAEHSQEVETTVSDATTVQRSARTLQQVRLARSLVREAEAYCALLERFSEGSTRDIARRLSRRLAALAHAAVEAFTRARLPTVVGIDDPHGFPFYRPEGLEGAAREIGHAIAAILGDGNGYWQSWDPPKAPEGPTREGPYFVSVDLTDLYIDLKSVLSERALSQDHDDIWTATTLLKDYRYHWHRHLGDALSVLCRIDVASRR